METTAFDNTSEGLYGQDSNFRGWAACHTMAMLGLRVPGMGVSEWEPATDDECQDPCPCVS